MDRLLHYFVAFLIVVALKAAWTWALLSALPLVHRNSVTVNAPKYTAAVQDALMPLHIPDLKIVEQRDPFQDSFLLAVLMEGSSVVTTLLLFFAALWLVRLFATKRGKSNQPLEATAGRSGESS